MPSVVGAFNTALISPGSERNAIMDAFGNIKLPLLESCLSDGIRPN
jgi:hypothetical protein